MIFFRSSLYFIALVLSAVVYGLIIVVFGRFLPLGFSDATATQWGKVNIKLLDVLCGLKVNVRGSEHFPTGAGIIMAKHQSTWETVALRGLLRKDQSWVVKKELITIPVFGGALRMVKAIAIDRAAGRKAMFQIVEDGSAALQSGRIVVIFPEGTRTAPGERRKYGAGGAILAEQTGVAVTPIAHNAGVFWRRRGIRKYSGTIELVVGPAIPTAGRKASAIMADVEAWIEGIQETLPLTPDIRDDSAQ